jgi:O-antigen/teichoic acid export membrane protein
MTIIKNLKFTINNFLRHPLFSGSFIMFAGSMGINVINYIYHLLMGRILGPSDYGILASLYSILYITSIVPASASMTIVKFISSAKNSLARANIYYAINKFVFSLALILSILLMIFSPAIAHFLKISNLWSVMIIGPILLLTLIILVNQATLQGILNFTGYVTLAFISSLGKLIFGLLFIFWGWSTFGAMVGILIGIFLTYLISLKFISWVIKNHKKGNYNLSSFFKYSLPVLIQALAFSSFFTTDLILVKHFFSPFEAGLYAALSTLGKIIFFASSPIAGTMFPIIAGRSARGENYSRILFASLGITTAISFSLILLYFMFPALSIRLLYGSAYLGATNNLVWMGIFIGFYCIAYLLINFFLSIGKTKIAIVPLILAIVQIAAIWFWHKSILGVIQISLSIMAALCLALFLYLGYNWKLCQGKKIAKGFSL